MKADRPSATARLVALGTALIAADRRLGRLVPARAAEASRWFIGPRLARLCDHGGFRALMAWMERAVIPGLRLPYALRKRFLEDGARRILGDGTSQVVILGGGFDSLALRLHADYPTVRFIEADHPATQRIKLKAREGRSAIGANLRFVSGDFATETLEEVLVRRAGLDPGLRTLFVIESVLMYLRPPDIDRIFSFARDRSPLGSRVAFTFMEKRDGGSVKFVRSGPLVNPWLRLMSEPFRWGLRPSELAGFLESRGFEPERTSSPELFRRTYLEPGRMGTPELAEGEFVVIAKSFST
jgi:methyltransferase (TIGR00027 family)